MTGNELGQIRAIARWAESSTAPDAKKIEGILRTLNALIEKVDRNRAKVIPESFVLAALPYAIENVGPVYRIRDHALLGWIMAQAGKEPQPETIEINQ